MKMHHEITFDQMEPFAAISLSGELNVSGYQLFLEDLLAHPKWKAGMNALIDIRAASLNDVTIGDLKMASDLVKYLKDALGSGGRCAIVLAGDAEFTKMAMWKVMTAADVGFKIEFFDSVEHAKKWLREGSSSP